MKKSADMQFVKRVCTSFLQFWLTFKYFLFIFRFQSFTYTFYRVLIVSSKFLIILGSLLLRSKFGNNTTVNYEKICWYAVCEASLYYNFAICIYLWVLFINFRFQNLTYTFYRVLIIFSKFLVNNRKFIINF